MSKVSALVLLTVSLAALPVNATDLCNGLVQDKLPHPMTPVAQPGLRQSYVDPQFGTTIRRITAAPVSTGGNAIIVPMYSTMQAWNADETYLILYDRTSGVGTHNLYDGKSYQFLQALPIATTDIEQVL